MISLQKELPVRKRTRLQGYDYSSAGAYFITICTKDMRKLFGEVENVLSISTGETVGANCVRPKLSDIGKIVEKEIHVISAAYDAVKVDAHVVMPNHIHLLISIIDNSDESGRTPRRFAFSKLAHSATFA